MAWMRSRDREHEHGHRHQYRTLGSEFSTSYGCLSRHASGSGSWRAFDPRRDMTNERRGRKLLNAVCRFIHGGEGENRGRRERANAAVPTGAASRSRIALGASAVLVIGNDTFRGGVPVLGCMRGIAHQVFHRHARLGGGADGRQMMRHAALEPRYACDGLHRQGNDKQAQ